MSKCFHLEKKRVENRLIKSNPIKSLNCLRSVWRFLWWFFSFSPMHSGLLQRLQTHWHPNVCLSWCNGRVWGLTTNFFEFYSFTLQIHIQINWSHKFSQIFPLQTLMMLMGFGWFSVFFWETYTMSIQDASFQPRCRTDTFALCDQTVGGEPKSFRTFTFWRWKALMECMKHVHILFWE